MDPMCEFTLNVILVILVLYIVCCRTVDDQGMDDYDRYYGIASDGYSRDSWGNIYKDGRYDVWSNLVDHNPYYNY